MGPKCNHSILKRRRQRELLTTEKEVGNVMVKDYNMCNVDIKEMQGRNCESRNVGVLQKLENARECIVF